MFEIDVQQSGDKWIGRVSVRIGGETYWIGHTDPHRFPHTARNAAAGLVVTALRKLIPTEEHQPSIFDKALGTSGLDSLVPYHRRGQLAR